MWDFGAPCQILMCSFFLSKDLTHLQNVWQAVFKVFKRLVASHHLENHITTLYFLCFNLTPIIRRSWWQKSWLLSCCTVLENTNEEESRKLFETERKRLKCVACHAWVVGFITGDSWSLSVKDDRFYSANTCRLDHRNRTLETIYRVNGWNIKLLIQAWGWAEVSILIIFCNIYLQNSLRVELQMIKRELFTEKFFINSKK